MASNSSAYSKAKAAQVTKTTAGQGAVKVAPRHDMAGHKPYSDVPTPGSDKVHKKMGKC